MSEDVGEVPPCENGIAVELGLLRRLEYLDLSENRLTGHIPAALGFPSRLGTLLLHENQLTGELPPTLAALPVHSLSLGGNAGLTGCVPQVLLWAWWDSAEDDSSLLECAPPPCENGLVVLGGRANRGLVPDCSILLAARDTLAGDATLNWDADTPITEWEGVTVSGALERTITLNQPDRVRGLELPERGLTGHIPPELGGLSALQSLRLGRNHLTGAVPPELGALLNLEVLRLDDNRFTGAIPASLGFLSNLRFLWLHENQLTGAIPDTFGSLGALRSLRLAENQLAGTIPVDLEYLPALDELSMDGNTGLTGCVLPRLRDAPENDLDRLGLPDCPPPPPLPTDLCENGVVVPNPGDNPGLVTDCAVLLASESTLTGGGTLGWDPGVPITAWEGVIVEGEPGRVRGLRLGRRGLAGRMPPELGQLTELRNLSLYENQLSGAIPAELGALGNLETLYLRINYLSGDIPAELGSLQSLQVLYLDGNELSGAIPAELGALGNLVDLWLDWWQLTGELPEELADVQLGPLGE